MAVPCRCGHILAFVAHDDDGCGGSITLLQSRRRAARLSIREYSRGRAFGDHWTLRGDRRSARLAIEIRVRHDGATGCPLGRRPGILSSVDCFAFVS
jgi:hypothetical protein